MCNDFIGKTYKEYCLNIEINIIKVLINRILFINNLFKMINERLFYQSHDFEIILRQ